VLDSKGTDIRGADACEISKLLLVVIDRLGSSLMKHVDLVAALPPLKICARA
jgi:hypothetical protein